MIDPTPNEIAAMRHGGQMGGQYLESINKTDLARLSGQEWHTFIEAVVSGYCEHLAELCARDEKRRTMMMEGVPF